MDPDDWPFNCCYGDGEQFEEDVLDHIRSTLWKNAVAVSLQKGDVVILDNFLAMHSRMKFEGPRKIVVQLFK